MPGAQHRQPWSKCDEEQLEALIRDEPDRRKLAMVLGRTVSAIDARLARLGLLEPRNRRA